MLLKLTADNFEAEVSKSEIPVLVDFWGEGCPPCKMIAPIIEKVAVEYAGKVKVAKALIEDVRDQAVAYDIMAIPTLIFFKDGEEVKRHLGYASESELKVMLNAL